MKESDGSQNGRKHLMAGVHRVISSPQYIDDKNRFRNNPRILKDLAKLERQLSRSGTRNFKELHRVGDLWTIRAGEGRRLLVRSEEDIVEIVRFDEHDDAYMAAGRTSLNGPVTAPTLSAETGDQAAPTALLDGHTDDFLVRLGVPRGDLPLVRRIVFPSQVYEYLVPRV